MNFIVSICAVCGNAIAARTSVCYACDTAVPSATVSVQGATAGAPVLSVRDFTALERFARFQLSPTGPVHDALLSKLEQSRMLPADAVMPDVASLGSRVVFAVEGGRAQGRVLVLPTQHSPAGWTLPVTTPRGLALLGHLPGTVVTAIRRDGTAESLRLLAVTYQPDAAAGADASALPTKRPDTSAREAAPIRGGFPI